MPDVQWNCSMNVPPGSKLKLTGRVTVCSGHLLLSRNNCKLLGGQVVSLVEGWKLKRVSEIFIRFWIGSLITVPILVLNLYLFLFCSQFAFAR